MNKSQTSLLSHFPQDFPAGIVVFLVALPLCLGIALASGAPLFSGIITGVLAGIVVGLLSGSHLSVSGPAAGLTVIVFDAITDLGSFEMFLLAVVIAGLMQIVFGVVKGGILGLFFPTSVIRGMLAAIGLTLILKQIPHFFGIDSDAFGDMQFFERSGENTFSNLSHVFDMFHAGAGLVGAISLGILILWERPFFKRIKLFKLIPGPLVAVLVAVGMNELIFKAGTMWKIEPSHLVSLPMILGNANFMENFAFPDWSAWMQPLVWKTAFVIAVIASLETLLSLEAIDKLDPHKRHSPKNRELLAQGVGNTLAGLIGGLPMTAVIVRSTANLESGNKTKMSAFYHGVLLALTVLFIPFLLNLIPLSALAAVLLLVGYKLSKPSLYRHFAKLGWEQFFPFLITIIAILFTDLLTGILIGLSIGVFFLLKANYSYAYHIDHSVDEKSGKNKYCLRLSEHVSFINKPSIQNALDHIPDNSFLLIDGDKTLDIEYDVLVLFKEFETHAKEHGITVEYSGVPMANRGL